MRALLHRPVALTLLSFAVGCVGSLDSPAGSADSFGPGSPGARPGEQPVGGPGTALACTTRGVGPAPLRHLTRVEYVRTLSDLLGLEVSLSDLPADDDTQGYEVGTSVSSLLVESYAKGAERLAAQVALNPLLACDPASTGEAACAATFIERFGRRAYRRPLGEDDRTGLTALYEAGRAALGFEAGIRLVIEAILQSPSFLYHVHDGSEPDATGLHPLTQIALADRLSYLIWGSMPDDALLDRIGKDLADPLVLESEARRMLAARPAAAQQGFRNFYRQWLQLDRLDTLVRDPARYPSFSESTALDLRASLDRQLDRAFESDGMAALFGSSNAFVNARIAPLFGTSAQGEELVEVALDGTTRKGLITHPGLLAALSKPNQSDPVIRGKFVRERFLCQQLSPPPPEVATTPPDPAPGASTRQRFAEHSTNPSCSGCHQMMDPIGFGLEHYDALGAYRELDDGVAVDANGEIIGSLDLDGKFQGGVELSERLAGSASVRDCVATQFFRYSLGRTETEQDACSLEHTRSGFAASQGDFRELLVNLVKTDAFRYRQAP